MAILRLMEAGRSGVVMGGVLGFLLYIGAVECFSQGIRISDADVELSNSAVADQVSGAKTGLPVSEGRKRAGANGVVLGRRLADSNVSRGRERVRLALYEPGTVKSSVLRDAVYREAARYRIDPELVFSLIWQESGGKLGVVSPKGARGPLQMLPETALRFGATNPHDPDQAVRAGVAYLVWLLDRLDGKVFLALAAYNSGELAVEAYLTGKTIVLKNGKIINRRAIKNSGIPPYNETENYVRRIARRYRMVKELAR